MTALEYSIAILVVILIGISKAGFAGGTGVLATPLFCLVVDARDAVSILLPILCACDWVSLYFYRKTFAPRPLLLCLPAAILGIGVGGALLGSVGSSGLRVVVGAIAILFVVDRSVRFTLQGETYPWRPGRVAASLLGLSAGLFSTLAHAAGPVMAAYLLPQKLGRQVFVGTTVVFFTVVNHLKLIPYGYWGRLEGGNLRQSALLLPFVPIGVCIGVGLNRRISERAFNIAVYGILFLTGLQLLGVPTPLDLLVRLWPAQTVGG